MVAHNSNWLIEKCAYLGIACILYQNFLFKDHIYSNSNTIIIRWNIYKMTYRKVWLLDHYFTIFKKTRSEFWNVDLKNGFFQISRNVIENNFAFFLISISHCIQSYCMTDLYVDVTINSQWKHLCVLWWHNEHIRHTFIKSLFEDNIHFLRKYS